MTREEYEAKVQSMPHELQKTFRETLEMSLSKRIVNRFMSTVMQAYAQGQRAAQKEIHDGAYMRGAEDILEAIATVSDMSADEIYGYFGVNYNYCNSLDGLCAIVHGNAEEIFETVDRYRNDKAKKKDELAKAEIQDMADTIGLEKLCEIVDTMRTEAAKNGDMLPF